MPFVSIIPSLAKGKHLSCEERQKENCNFQPNSRFTYTPPRYIIKRTVKAVHRKSIDRDKRHRAHLPASREWCKAACIDDVCITRECAAERHTIRRRRMTRVKGQRIDMRVEWAMPTRVVPRKRNVFRPDSGRKFFM